MQEKYLGTPACILTIIYYLFPQIPFIKMFKTKFDIENISIIKIYLNYMISFFWLFYAINIPYKQIIFCSRFGIYSSLISIFIYLFFEFKKDLIDSILNGLILIICSFSFYHYFTYILGFIPSYGRFCMMSNFIAFLYYAYIIYQVIITNNYVLIDYYSCIISLCASFFWYIFGIINEDFYIKIVYGIEALFDLVQILLYKYFSRKYNQLNSENINFEIKDLKKIENTEINDSKNDDDNTIEIDDNKQNFSKYENL